MGRTGRRQGQVANSTFFCETEEGVLQAIALIELAKSGWVENVEVNNRCWPVLIHQLLAMSLAHNGIAVEEAWSHLSVVPDFQGVGRDEFDRLIAWMLQDESLVLASGQLVLGSKAERRFGRKNFMELYAVFSSPQSYTVQMQNGQPLGTLNQAFVDRLVDHVSCFLLSGRAWAVVYVDHDDRRVIVEPAPRGRQPTWGGYRFGTNQPILALVSKAIGRGWRGQFLQIVQRLADNRVFLFLHPIFTARHAVSEFTTEASSTAPNGAFFSNDLHPRRRRRKTGQCERVWECAKIPRSLPRDRISRNDGMFTYADNCVVTCPVEWCVEA